MYGIIFSAGVQVRRNYYSLSGEISQYLLLYSSLFPTFEYLFEQVTGLLHKIRDMYKREVEMNDIF